MCRRDVVTGGCEKRRQWRGWLDEAHDATGSPVRLTVAAAATYTADMWPQRHCESGAADVDAVIRGLCVALHVGEHGTKNARVTPHSRCNTIMP